MRRLVLVRHAKTHRDSESGKDQDRRLDQRGLSDSALIGAWLSDHRIAPDRVLVSTATRTRQTCEIIKDTLPKSEIVFLDDLYLASAVEIVRIIRATPAPIGTLLIIGHNPGLHEAAWALTGNASVEDRDALSDNFPTAAVAVIDFPIHDWKKLKPDEGTLSLFTTPKKLKQDTES